MSHHDMSSLDMEDYVDPLTLFEVWFGEAKIHEPNDPNAMALATVDETGLPNVRMVLLKGVDAAITGMEKQEAVSGEATNRESKSKTRGGEWRSHEQGMEKIGFVFYTNYQSAKGKELLGSEKAALCFHWKSLRRQVRLRGVIEQVSDNEADDYYHSRPRGSQIGAWASQQSRPLPSRAVLEQAVADYEARFGADEIIDRPPYWSGFRLVPLRIEFWHDRPFRLHDRIVFSRPSPEAKIWQKTRLYP